MNRQMDRVDRINFSACLRVAAMGVFVAAFICITLLQTSQPDKAMLAQQLREESHRGNLLRVNELLREGAAVDQADTYGITALIEASRTGSDACIERLLKAGANVNVCANVYGTPLIQATMNRHESTVDILLKHGASPNLRSPGTNSALFWAIDLQEQGMIRLLQDYGGKSIHV